MLFSKNFKQCKILVKVLITVIIFAILSLSTYSIMWYASKKSLESHFQSGIRQASFTFDESLGYYVKEEGKVVYYAPNQKMPAWHQLKLDFAAKSIWGNLNTELGTVTIRLLESNFITVNFNDSKNTTINLDSSGNIITEHLSDNVQEDYNKIKNSLADSVETALSLYNSLYK